MEPGLMPDARKDKATVNYRRNERCGQCDYYYPSGTCELVAGAISPDMVCDLFEVKTEHPQGKDRSYYESEYTKSKGA